MEHFDRLIDGYRRFRENQWEQERDRWATLATGQSPKVMVIACSDSRVDPAQIFNAGPGEMFVVRNVAALAPPFETSPGLHGVSAALEFAVTQLEVEEIVVLGHAACGGCAAALSGAFKGAEHGAGHFIADWVDQLSEAADTVRSAYPELGAEAQQAMEMEGVKVSLRNLRSFPWIAERERDGRLKLRGAHFGIAEGRLSILNEAEHQFRPA
jgi:carbonic anhydrase